MRRDRGAPVRVEVGSGMRLREEPVPAVRRGVGGPTSVSSPRKNAQPGHGTECVPLPTAGRGAGRGCGNPFSCPHGHVLYEGMFESSVSAGKVRFRRSPPCSISLGDTNEILDPCRVTPEKCMEHVRQRSILEKGCAPNRTSVVRGVGRRGGVRRVTGKTRKRHNVFPRPARFPQHPAARQF